VVLVCSLSYLEINQRYT